MEGDHLVGAKQNRTLNTTILAPARDKVFIPVSCVERDRWSYRSQKFQYSDDYHFAKGRRGKSSSVSAAMKVSARSGRVNRRSDQREVWGAIGIKQSRLNADSATSAMGDIYRSRESQLNEYLREFEYVDNMFGAVFMVGKEVSGIEYFGCRDTLKAYLPRVVKSYAMDALEVNEPLDVTIDDAATLIQQLLQTEVKEYPSVGKGFDVRLDGDLVVGGGLTEKSRLIHFSGFKDNGKMFH